MQTLGNWHLLLSDIVLRNLRLLSESWFDSTANSTIELRAIMTNISSGAQQGWIYMKVTETARTIRMAQEYGEVVHPKSLRSLLMSFKPQNISFAKREFAAIL